MSLTEKKPNCRNIAATLAHEIRNPLNVIMLHTSLLKRSATLSISEREHLQMINEEALRLDKYVSSIVHDITGIIAKKPL